MGDPSQGKAAALLVTLVTLLVWAPRARFGFALPAPYDEGNTVVAAWRVLEGDLLYRDVWQMHAPGTAYLLASAFKLFGTTLVVERLLKVLLLAASGVLLGRLAGRVASPAFAAAPALLFVLDRGQYPFLRPNDPALALSLLTLLLALRCMDGRKAAAVLAGITTGAAAAFRFDFGLYTAGAIALVLVHRHDPRRLAAFASGVTFALVPVVMALRFSATLDAAIAQALVFPATVYVESRRLPIFDIAAFGLPLSVLVAAVALAWRRRDDALLLVTLAGLAFYGYARLRPDAEHLLPAGAFAMVAGFGLLDRWPHRVLSRLAAVVVVLALAIPAVAFHVPRVWAALRTAPQSAAPASARGFAGFPAGLLDAVSFLDARSPTGGPVFIGNLRHDRISLNHTLLYFLAQRRGATRYYNLHPGLVTTRAVQREVVASLDDVPAIVLWNAPLWDEPNLSGRSSGVHDLDTAIRERYREVAHWGAFSGWERSP